MHVLFHVRSLFVSDLAPALSELLDARIHNLERSMLSMSFQDVSHGLVSVYAEQLAEVWIQREINLPLLQEIEYSHVLLL